MAYAIQNARDKAEQGGKAPWYAVWMEGNRKRSQKVGKKRDALDIAKSHELARKQRRAGILPDMPWAEFRAKYEKEALPQMRSELSRDLARQSLKRFEEIAKPGLIGDVTFSLLNEFVNARLKMRGRNPGSTASAATIKKELRTIHAALSFALKSLYLSAVPVFPKVDGFETEKRFVTPEHLDAMLANCKVAKYPDQTGYPAPLWWDALLTLLWFAPNRIASVLSLHWDDVDLDAGVITTKASHVKQKKTHRAHVPAVVVEKLEQIRRFSPVVFPWPRSRKTLYSQFFAIQTAAGIKLKCDGDHEHTDACGFYGFHDFRRSFATLNDMQNLPASFVQNQMGHSTYQTTMKYVKYSGDQRKYVQNLASTPGLDRRQPVQAGVL